MCVHMADSHCYTAETTTTLSRSYTKIKNGFKIKRMSNKIVNTESLSCCLSYQCTVYLFVDG